MLDCKLTVFTQADEQPGLAGRVALLTQEERPGGAACGDSASVIGGHMPWTSTGEATALDFLDNMQSNTNTYMDRLVAQLRDIL